MRYFSIIMLLLVTLVAHGVNHQAVIITGADTTGRGAEKSAGIVLQTWDKPDADIEKLFGCEADSALIEEIIKSDTTKRCYNSFWNDTYLMWELLYKDNWWMNRGIYPVYTDQDHINVLYAYGEDQYTGYRYKPYYLDRYWRYGDIVDDSAYYEDVYQVFTQLASEMSDSDNLIIYTFNHGMRGSGLTVIDTTLSEYGKAKVPGSLSRVVLDGNYAYVSDWDYGLRIFDVTDPTSPSFISQCLLPHGCDVTVFNNRAYVACREGPFILVYIVNIADPYNPHIYTYGVTHGPFIPTGIDVSTYIYVTAIAYKAGIIMVFDPDVMIPGDGIRFDTLITIDAYCWDVQVDGNYIYVAADTLGVLKINKFTMEIVDTGETFGKAKDIDIQDDLIYAANDTDFVVLDKNTLSIVGRCSEEIQSISRVSVENFYAYVVDRKNKAILKIDVTDPTSPSVIGDYSFTEGRLVDVYAYNEYVYSIDIYDKQVYLGLMDTLMSDADFASLANLVNYHKRIVWMQQCFSGGFIDNLEGTNTVMLTASENDEFAYVADDVSRNNSPLPENETYEGKTFYHGEFNFHIMNAVRKKAIWGTSYEDPPPVDADYNNDFLISMEEAFYYVSTHDSRNETPQYSDMGEIGSSTYLAWDDYTPPDTPTGLSIVEIYYTQLPNRPGYYYLVHLDWDSNTEPDLAAYSLYRRISPYESDFTRVKCVDSSETWDTVMQYPPYYPGYGVYVYYYVTAYDIAANESEPSNTVGFWMWPPSEPGSPASAKFIIAGLGNPEPSPYLVQRAGYRVIDSNHDVDLYPEYSVDYHPERLVYRFTGLDPVKEYWIAAILCRGHDDPATIERMYIDGIPVLTNLTVVDTPRLVYHRIPHILYTDSVITIELQRVSGGPAIASELILAEVTYTPGFGGGMTSNEITKFDISEVSPNPATSHVTIKLAVPYRAYINLSVYDITGRLIHTLIADNLNPGYYTLEWDVGHLPIGVYFLKLQTDHSAVTKKLVVIR